jgi:hypothetical protein
MATNNSLPIGGFGLNGSGNPNALTNQPGMMKLPVGMSPMTINPNGSVGTNQTSTAGLFSNANGSPVKGAGAPLTFSQGLMNSAVKSSSPVVNSGSSSTSGAGTGGSNARGNNNQNNQNGGGSTGTSTADLNAAHQAKVDAITKQISDLQGQLKTKQDQEAANVASYPAGTTPQKDANGDTIPYVAPPTPTIYSQAQTGLLNRANGQESPQVTAARQALEDTQNKEAGMLSQIGGAGSPQTSGSAAGSAMTDQSLMNSQIGNEQQALTSALASQGQQITAGQSVAAPTQVSPANTLVDPTTGLPIGGGTAGALPASAQTAVNGLIDNVKNGVISYQDAVSQLSSYGPNAVNALLPAIQAKYPGFNVNQANAQSSAQESNTTLAGTTNALIDKANGALSNLPALFDALSPLQQTGSGWLGDTVNGLSTGSGIGATATNAYNAQLNEARAAVNAVLNSAINLGVQTGGATANSLLPDNMSKASLTKNTEVIQNLMQQTKDALAKLSNASPTSGSSGSNAFGNTFPTS